MAINRFENIPGGTKVTFDVEDKTYEVVTNLKNEFNVYNYLTALNEVIIFSTASGV